MNPRVCIMYRRTELMHFDLASCHACAHEKEWDVVAEIGVVVDGGQNAAERKMLKLIRHRKIDILMISELECLGTIRDMYRIAGMLIEKGIKLYRLR